MAAKGGARKGAGRPTKVDEERVRTLAINAIIKTHGSENKGFEALLATGDPSLKKWVFEHAYGKPKENLNVKHEGGVNLIFKRVNG